MTSSAPSQPSPSSILTRPPPSPQARLIPVYCTAEISPEVKAQIPAQFLKLIKPQIIDKLITRSEERAPPRLYLVDSIKQSRDDPKSCHATTVPTKRFQSPFIGWSITQLKDHYIEYVPETGFHFSSLTYIVLDERTLVDETCCLVSIRVEPSDPQPEGYITARADFYVPVEVLIPVDVMVCVMNEAEDETSKDEYGCILYTKERMIERMGPNFNMNIIEG